MVPETPVVIDAMVPFERRHGRRAAVVLPALVGYQQVLDDRRKKYQDWYNDHGGSDEDSDSDGGG
jgi:hypothetical protein